MKTALVILVISMGVAASRASSLLASVTGQGGASRD
jgi:hypothetical protein